jgi:hypothetical protein|tara:strand:- start:167 stop:532 length:366 start_codon:yes stop_codon:yes gene_type:complete
MSIDPIVVPPAEVFINSDGECTLRFRWDSESHYEDEDEDILDVELEDMYTGKTWQEACNDAADCYDWDDEDVINFDAESDLIETSRDFIDLCYLNEKNEWVEVSAEIQDYYNKAEEKAMGL